MAKLSRRKSIHVSFLLHKMAFSHDAEQRESLLAALLDALGIDGDLGEDSAASARRSLRFDADKKRKAAKPVDSKADPDIDNMSLDELRTHNAGLRAKLDRMLDRKQIADMSDEERRRYIAELLAKRDEVLQQPAPTVEEAPTYTINEKQRRRLAAFDDLPEADQVDQLRAMWGAS